MSYCMGPRAILMPFKIEVQFILYCQRESTDKNMVLIYYCTNLNKVSLIRVRILENDQSYYTLIFLDWRRLNCDEWSLVMWSIKVVHFCIYKRERRVVEVLVLHSRGIINKSDATLNSFALTNSWSGLK